MRLLDTQLDGKDFVAGETFTITDITALCAIDFAIACGTDMPADARRLRAWYDRVSKRPSASA